LSPRDEFCPLGGRYPLSVKFSVHLSIFLNSRERSLLGVNEGVNISPWGKFKNGPQSKYFILLIAELLNVDIQITDNKIKANNF
jgi:hypothetical protein